MKKILLLFIISVISCNKPLVDKKLVDKDYEKMKKIRKENLTKIEVPALISLDTIDQNEKDISINIKNVGKKDLKPLILRFHCACITPPKYDTIIKQGKEQIIKINFPIDKKGNFSYPIFVYGNFYPFVRTIYIEGYRK